MSAHSTHQRRRTPQTLAVCLVVAFSLFSGIRVFTKEWRQYRRVNQADDVTRYEHRLERLRLQLPPGGVVGFVSTPSVGARGKIDPLYTSQYSLCPVVLSNRSDLPLVIGNFDAVGPPPLDPGLHLVEDFGDGIMLYRREP